jgi:endoglucanase
MRNGVVWAPHGLNCIAFVASPLVRTGAFGAAYKNFSATELAAMKAWGADTIRFQVSQAALDIQDPTSPSLYDPSFLGEVVAGVTAARAIGLNVIVSVQDESGTGEATPTPLPNPGTGRAWEALAPAFKGDNGIMFEILNEPEPNHTAANWALWAAAMNNMVTIIRNAGATNVLIADGLNYAEQLDGAPTLADPLNQVAYGSHPYAHSIDDQTVNGNGMPFKGWDAKFGNVSVSSVAPVIVTEWSLENDIAATNGNNTFQYCDSGSNQAGLNLLDYLQGKGIGLLAFSYDLPNQPMLPRTGRVMLDLNGTPSTLANVTCSDSTFGVGTIVQTWYRTGAVPAKPI